MIPLPFIISAAWIRSLPPTGDTHAVRMIMLTTSGPTTYTLRGIKRKYLLDRDGVTGRHILDIPVSIWSQGLPSERYHDNTSIAHDLQSKPHPLCPFVTVVVPWNGGGEALETQKPDFFTPLRDLLIHTDAPPYVIEALDLARGEDNSALVEYVKREIDRFENEEQPDPATPKKSDPSAAKRMREKRARDKAAKSKLSLQ